MMAPAEQAHQDFMVDVVTGQHFSSVGSRTNPRAPIDLPPEDAAEYLRAYLDAARRFLGPDWQTRSL